MRSACEREVEYRQRILNACIFDFPNNPRLGPFAPDPASDAAVSSLHSWHSPAASANLDMQLASS